MSQSIVPKRRTRVLCVDDNLDMLECLQSFLETFGYAVQISCSLPCHCHQADTMWLRWLPTCPLSGFLN